MFTIALFATSSFVLAAPLAAPAQPKKYEFSECEHLIVHIRDYDKCPTMGDSNLEWAEARRILTELDSKWMVKPEWINHKCALSIIRGQEIKEKRAICSITSDPDGIGASFPELQKEIDTTDTIDKILNALDDKKPQLLTLFNEISRSTNVNVKESESYKVQCSKCEKPTDPPLEECKKCDPSLWICGSPQYQLSITRKPSNRIQTWVVSPISEIGCHNKNQHREYYNNIKTMLDERLKFSLALPPVRRCKLVKITLPEAGVYYEFLTPSRRSLRTPVNKVDDLKHDVECLDSAEFVNARVLAETPFSEHHFTISDSNTVGHDYNLLTKDSRSSFLTPVVWTAGFSALSVIRLSLTLGLLNETCITSGGYQCAGRYHLNPYTQIWLGISVGAVVAPWIVLVGRYWAFRKRWEL